MPCLRIPTTSCRFIEMTLFLSLNFCAIIQTFSFRQNSLGAISLDFPGGLHCGDSILPLLGNISSPSLLLSKSFRIAGTFREFLADDLSSMSKRRKEKGCIHRLKLADTEACIETQFSLATITVV